MASFYMGDDRKSNTGNELNFLVLPAHKRRWGLDQQVIQNPPSAGNQSSPFLA